MTSKKACVGREKVSNQARSARDYIHMPTLIHTRVFPATYSSFSSYSGTQSQPQELPQLPKPQSPSCPRQYGLKPLLQPSGALAVHCHAGPVPMLQLQELGLHVPGSGFVEHRGTLPPLQLLCPVFVQKSNLSPSCNCFLTSQHSCSPAQTW